MYRVIYHFHLKPNCEPEFERVVAGWAHAMKHHAGFIAISLLRDAADPGKFVALSDWVSAEKYAAFHASADHQVVANASARLFITEERHTYEFVYQATVRDGDAV
jgi:heme-degrading monooxygenase HmoA